MILASALLATRAFAAPVAPAPTPPAPAPPTTPPPTIEVTQTRVEIEHAASVSTDLLFDVGQATLRDAGKPVLDAIAKALSGDQTSQISVRCYTDNSAPDSDRTGGFNTKLSQARAEAVVAYLTKKGVAAKRLSARGMGQDQPIGDNGSDEGRRANRRVELLVQQEVRPPEAADLATYTKNLKGKGALTATIATNQGTLHCQLFDDKAPMAVANFIGLATGQKPWTDPATKKTVRGKPFYDGLTFHRVIPHFMIQGGDPLGNGTGGPGYSFADEIVPGLTHKPGILAMANAGPNTNGSQFFIDEVQADWINDHYTIFGQCKETDIVSKIAAVPRGEADKPTTPVVIQKVTISRAP